MKDSNGVEYLEVPEYPEDDCWRIGTLHLVNGELEIHCGEIGEVVRHGRSPLAQRSFSERVLLSEISGIPLSDKCYDVLILGEGPVLLFADGSEHWYPGMTTKILTAITGDDPVTLDRKRNDEATD